SSAPRPFRQRSRGTRIRRGGRRSPGRSSESGNSLARSVAYSGMDVQELWRYPVKSMRGERLESAEIGRDGVRGDRLVHVRERGGRVVTSRYRPALLGFNGTL